MSGLRSIVAQALVHRAAGRLPLKVTLPGDRGQAPPHHAVLRVHRPEAFYRKLGSGGLIGFGESYQDGDWDSDDLTGLLTVLAGAVSTLVPPWLQGLRRFFVQRQPGEQSGAIEHTRHNIARHYDLSNHLFGTFLDETMTYSSALFGGTPPVWENLAAAQRRKIDRLLDLTGTGPGTRLLEIGTGWGALAVRAAQRGAHVHTVTLSSEQRHYAIAAAAEAGVSDRVHIDLCDYRRIDSHQRYDVIVSVEMIEAVGEHYWPVYFEVLRRLLAPGGRIGLQAITMDHQRMLATRNTYTWIQKYIFPGGLIPSVEAIRRHSQLPVTDLFAFGPDYAATLRLWRERFLDRFASLAPLGFDERFRRTWELYLAYCEAGFASGYLNVHQLVLGGPR